MSLNGQHNQPNGDSRQDTWNATTTGTCQGSKILIDVEQVKKVYDGLDELVRSFKQSTKEASSIDKTSQLVDKNDSSTLVDIDMKTPDVCGCLDLWAQRLFESVDGNSQTKEHSPKAVMTTLTGTTATDLTDVFDNGKMATETIATTAQGCYSCPDALPRTPDHATVARRLQTPEGFLTKYL